jgi:hypothetical protein
MVLVSVCVCVCVCVCVHEMRKYTASHLKSWELAIFICVKNVFVDVYLEQES